MAYIGKEPLAGNFVKLDAITTSATATYALTRNSVAFKPANAESLLVSLNGVTQAPLDAYTVNDTNIVFASALTSSDTIDYILALGEIGAVTTPADSTVDTPKLTTGAVTAAKLATDSVTTIKIADDAVTGAKIENNPTIAGNLTVSGNIVGTLTTVAQPNITSVGTLTGLTSSGDVDINKLLTVDNQTSNEMVTTFEGTSGKVHIGAFGHILQQNTNNGTTNFWGFATRGSAHGARFDIGYGAATSNGVVATSDNIMGITTAGNVGIGTDSPTSPLGTNYKALDINSGVWGGTVNFSGNSGGYIGNRHSGNGGLGYYAASGQGHHFATNGSTTAVTTINSDGRVGIGAVGESTVKLEVNASALATTISGRSDGGNGNNRRFNLNAVASGNGTYGGGLKIETRNDSNVFSEIFEYNAYQQEIFKGNYRTADNQTYSDKKHFYCTSENLDFTTTTNGVSQTLTGTTTLPYQMGTPFFVRVYYNGDSALMTTVYGIFDIGYHNHKVQTLMTHNGTGTINSVTVGSTGSYNSAKLTVTLSPYSSYNANNFSGTIYYGYGVN